MWHVLRALRPPVASAVLIGAIASAGAARAETARVPGGLYDVSLPGGVQAAATAIGEHVPVDRSQFLLEFVRRTYNRPHTIQNHQRDALLQTLTAHLDRALASGAAAERLPLPLPPELWIESVFASRETPATLLRAIVRSRSAALLYYGLLSLDERTRAWLETQPALVSELAERAAAAFVLAAPGLRVHDGAMALPGGPGAVQGWESIVGKRASEPAAFIQALVHGDEGRLAYFLGSLAQLSPARLVLLLGGESRATERSAALKRVHSLYKRVAADWRIDNNVFWRPPLDPALLAANVPTDGAGEPVIPRSRRFWTAVFAENGPAAHRGTNGDSSPSDAVVDFQWVCEQVFSGGRGEDRRRYQLVLFASRLVPGLERYSREAVDAVRAHHTFPALARALERARLTDVAAHAAAVRRAASLASVEGDRAPRVLAQFQGALALLTRSAIRGTTPAEALPGLVTSLAAIEPTPRGDYEGRLVRWLVDWLEAHAGRMPGAAELDVATAGPVERDTIALLSGPIDVAPRFVDWEGTRYRLDHARAEAVRIAALIGEPALPYLSSARALLSVADALGQPANDSDGLKTQSAALRKIGAAVQLDRPASWRIGDAVRRYREADDGLQRAAQSGDAKAAARVAPAVLLLADELLARGLMEIAYALALGQPDRAPIRADEAAQRHEFVPGIDGISHAVAWSFPTAGAMPGHGWRVAGSLLGLDVRLAEFAQVPLSSRLPPRRPTLEEDRRRVLAETVVLVQPGSLIDTDRDTIVAAMTKGRARLASARSVEQALALADEIQLGAARRTLLPWVIANEPARAAAFLSPLELFWLGLERSPVPAPLHAWGASADARLGCLCLQLLDRQPWESLAGRWHSGVLASGFPDLNLRLAELLAELQMPASLLASVLGAATLELYQLAASRDSDDRRSLVEVVATLRRDRVEQYLALLTADGPLVPVHSGARQ